MTVGLHPFGSKTTCERILPRLNSLGLKWICILNKKPKVMLNNTLKFEIHRSGPRLLKGEYGNRNNYLKWFTDELSVMNQNGGWNCRSWLVFRKSEFLKKYMSQNGSTFWDDEKWKEVSVRNFIVAGFKYLINQHQFSENFQNANEPIRKKLFK